MKFEDFKKDFDKAYANVSDEEIIKAFADMGCEVEAVQPLMKNKHEDIEDIREVASDIISDLFFEGRITREEWTEIYDEIDSTESEDDLRNLIKKYENL